MRILKKMPTTKSYKDLKSKRNFKTATMDSNIRVRISWGKRSILNLTIRIVDRKRIWFLLFHRRVLKLRILCVDQVLNHLQCTVLCNTITLRISCLLENWVISKGAYSHLTKVSTLISCHQWVVQIKIWLLCRLQGSVEVNILGNTSPLRFCSHITLKVQWVSLQLNLIKTSWVFNLQQLVTKAIKTTHSMTTLHLSFKTWLLDNWANLRAGITVMQE